VARWCLACAALQSYVTIDNDRRGPVRAVLERSEGPYNHLVTLQPQATNRVAVFTGPVQYCLRSCSVKPATGALWSASWPSGTVIATGTSDRNLTAAVPVTWNTDCCPEMRSPHSSEWESGRQPARAVAASRICGGAGFQNLQPSPMDGSARWVTRSRPFREGTS
jgi:hypothetical protein